MKRMITRKNVEDIAHISNGTSDTTKVYNKGLQVDENGDVTVGRDLYVEDEVVTDDYSKWVDSNGDQIIPTLTGNLGKFLKVGSTGMTWDEPSGGTQLYNHLLNLKFSDNSTQELNIFLPIATAFTMDNIVSLIGSKFSNYPGLVVSGVGSGSNVNIIKLAVNPIAKSVIFTDGTSKVITAIVNDMVSAL